MNNVISKATEIVKKLRAQGLSNGSSLGHHSGFNDEVADFIEMLMESHVTNTEISVILPDGKILKSRGFQDEQNPAINIYLENNEKEECICFAEYNLDKNPGKELCVGAYVNTQEDTTYYDSWNQDDDQN